MSRLLLILLLFAADETDEADVGAAARTTIAGVIATAPTESGFDLQSAQGKFVVALTAGTEIVVHEAVPLEKVAGGTRLFLLARRQGASGEPGNYLRAQIIQINTVVAIKGFSPPALTEAQKEAKLSWISGTLSRDKQRYSLDGTNMQIGKDRLVLTGNVTDHNSKPLAKGQNVRIEGSLSGDKKEHKVAANAVVVLARQFPPKEYELVIGGE